MAWGKAASFEVTAEIGSLAQNSTTGTSDGSCPQRDTPTKHHRKRHPVRNSSFHCILPRQIQI